MPTVYVPKVYDTNIQKNYNLPNVALTINGVETNSSATTFNMNNTGGTFSVIAQKKHYNSYGRNGCSIVSEYDCSVCGAPVIGGEGTLCPNCGEPLTTEGKTAKLRVAADYTGKILMTREVSDICMTECDFKDIVSGASPSGMLSGLNNNERLIMNAKSYGGSTVTGWVNTFLSSKIEMSANTATGSDKKAFKIKSSFVPKPIPEDYSDYKYIRVISGKTHNINSSEQTINSVIRTNIPLPYNFVSASSVNWITNFRYFEDLHHPDFSLIKVVANVSENDSLTDARSGVITISDSTYGVSGAITVNQSAKTEPQIVFTWSNNTTAKTQTMSDGDATTISETGITSTKNGSNTSFILYDNIFPYLENSDIEVNSAGRSLTIHLPENGTREQKIGVIRLKNADGKEINLTINQPSNYEQSYKTIEGYVFTMDSDIGIATYINNTITEPFDGSEFSSDGSFRLSVPEDGGWLGIYNYSGNRGTIKNTTQDISISIESALQGERLQVFPNDYIEIRVRAQ